LLSDPLPKLCVNTKIQREDVLAELKVVKRRGFATCVNENELGITAIACPIPLAGIGVIYSVGVMALSDHLPEERVLDAVAILKTTAAELAAGTGLQRNT
jgi:DNA-binding IclR family transcriptional regulator